MADITPAITYAQSEHSSPSDEKHDFHDEKAAPRLNRSSEPEVAVLPAIVKVEALSRIFKKKSLWFVYASLAAAAYVLSLDSNTTYNYLIFATSQFEVHSAISAINVAEGIIGAVGTPFVARISDVTSRPTAYLWSLIFYVVGYAVISGSKNVAQVAAGTLFIKLGNTGLGILNAIIVADLTSLQWRSFWTGFLFFPYVINAFVAGKVVASVVAVDGIGWRWGYGMFAILTPFCLAPLVACTYYAQIKAAQIDNGMESDSVVDALKLHMSTLFVSERQGPWYQRWWDSTYEFAIAIDAVGLCLLAAAFALFLLPFTLAAYQPKGFAQPSMIAMLVLGFVGFFVFGAWEKFYAVRPIMPRRIAVNNAFINACLINFFYLFGGDIPLLYMGSYVYVGKPWSVENWTYYSNTLTVALCFFCVPAGLIIRYTHRYKWLQFSGLAIRVIGSGLALKSKTEMANDASIILSAVFIGMGGAISVICSQTAVQASVPHSDLAAVTSLLPLWSSLGGSIGYAIAGAIWTNSLPKNLAKHLDGLVDATEIATIYGSTTYIRATYEFGTAIRDRIILAYVETEYPLLIIGLALSFVPLASAAIMPDYYFGDTVALTANERALAEGKKIHDSESQNADAEPKDVVVPTTIVPEAGKGTLRAFFA